MCWRFIKSLCDMVKRENKNSRKRVYVFWLGVRWKYRSSCIFIY
eukprot:UN11413